MIDVDNTQPTDYHNDCEPDMASYSVDNDKAIPTLSKQQYDAYMANNDNFSNDEDQDEDTPEKMNNWLRQGGW